MKNYIKQKELKNILNYNYKTGELFWKINKQGVCIGRKAGCFDRRYIRISVNNKLYEAHRLIWIYNYGDIPKDMQIDHINHNGLDNRLKNLRLVSDTENKRNQKLYKTNSSGYCGVYFSKIDNKWLAEIRPKGKHVYLGLFTNIKDAVKARKEADIKYGFHKNHGKSIKKIAKILNKKGSEL